MNTETKLGEKVKSLKDFLNDFFSIYERRIHRENLAKKEESNRQLIDSINTAKNDWLTAQNNFELANSDETVDYYAYKIKACEVRYQALLKKAKEQGVKINSLDRMK